MPQVSLLNATLITPAPGAPPVVVEATPQIGETIATLNTQQDDNLGYIQPNATVEAHYPQYNKKNQGVQDSICGCFLHNIY